MSAVDEIVDAAKILKDWVGEGGVPVDSSLSDHRAYICAGCPENRGGKWWETAKHQIAEVIKIHLEIKNGMHIATQFDNELNMCRVCGCATVLKVHVPIGHIVKNTEPETLAKFPSHCWIQNEAKPRQ